MALPALLKNIFVPTDAIHRLTPHMRFRPPSRRASPKLLVRSGGASGQFYPLTHFATSHMVAR